MAGLNGLAWNYPYLGQFDEALMAARKGLALDPANSEMWFVLIGQSYLHLGELEQVEKWANKALEIAPDQSGALGLVGFAALCRGELEEAERNASALPVGTFYRSTLLGIVAERREDYDKAAEHYQKDPALRIHLARIFIKKDKREEAEQLLGEMAKVAHEWLAQGVDSWSPRRDLVWVSALRGNKEEAYRWLQEAFDLGWRDVYSETEYNPVWDSLRDEPRFQQLMVEINAEKAEMIGRVADLEKEWEQ
jgi:tetratricopeptide (TPR) repeat protein